MTTWKDLREEILSDPDVKAEYDALEQEQQKGAEDD